VCFDLVVFRPEGKGCAVALEAPPKERYHSRMSGQVDLNNSLLGIKDTLLAHHVQLAYVYGSTASREARHQSDVDLAVLLPRGLSASKKVRYSNCIAGETNLQI
jgi:hypothetical protein